jgi:hypothetical protein
MKRAFPLLLAAIIVALALGADALVLRVRFQGVGLLWFALIAACFAGFGYLLAKVDSLAPALRTALLIATSLVYGVLSYLLAPSRGPEAVLVSVEGFVMALLFALGGSSAIRRA